MVALVCGIAGLFCGCESTSDGHALTVSPSSVSTSNRYEIITFEVAEGTNTTSESGLRDLSLPLEWWVSNPNLGSISGSSGTTASYILSSGSGTQTIYVKDQYGAEGHATVSQQ